MESIGNTINYLSIEGLPWVLLAWIGLIVFRPFATLVHEIGHLIPAVILTKKEVLIRVGQSGKSWQGKFRLDTLGNKFSKWKRRVHWI